MTFPNTGTTNVGIEPLLRVIILSLCLPYSPGRKKAERAAALGTVRIELMGVLEVPSTISLKGEVTAVSLLLSVQCLKWQASEKRAGRSLHIIKGGQFGIFALGTK